MSSHTIGDVTKKMESVTPAQFFRDGQSFTVELKFDDTTIGVRIWAVRTTLEMGDDKQATPGFSIFAKGDYPRGGSLKVDIPELPYDKMWPMINEIVTEAVSHLVFDDYPAACKKAQADLEEAQKKKDDSIQYFEKEPGFRELQEVVGGYFTLQRTLDGRIMAMNEEGILQELPINKGASRLAGQEVRGRVAVYDEEDEEEEEQES